MATKTISAPNLSDDGGEIEDGSSRFSVRSTSEKRKHAETEDVPRQSQPPPPSEKRNRGENQEQAISSKPGGCKPGLCPCEGCGSKGGGGGGDISRKLTPAAERYFQRLKDELGDRLSLGANDVEFGDTGLTDEDLKFGLNLKERSLCCSNPFKPLPFKEDLDFYNALKAFGIRVAAYYNRIYGLNFTFEDIKALTSCGAPCKHHLVTLNVKDPGTKYTVIIIRGKVKRGFAKAKVCDFARLEMF